MARIRTIKPSFFRHSDLFDAERESGLPLRVAYAGLWTAADREGRFKWDERELKLDCLPFDDVDFSRVLDALATRGFIKKYASSGKEYGFIPSWSEHQVINNREADSKLPQPNENNEVLTRAPRVTDASPTPLKCAQGEGKGKEGKGKEETKTAIAVATKDFVFSGSIIKLTAENFSKWQSAYTALNLKSELVARDDWLAGRDPDDSARKNWFVSTSKYLANRNSEAIARAAAASAPAKDNRSLRERGYVW